MKPLDTVKITKCSKPEYIGFVGKLYTNLKYFHANANLFPITDILQIDKNENCIGIIGQDKNGQKGAFWWTKNSDFDVEIEITTCNYNNNN